MTDLCAASTKPDLLTSRRTPANCISLRRLQERSLSAQMSKAAPLRIELRQLSVTSEVI
jgi:hypothetical protein